MRLLKRLIISFVLCDNFLTNFSRKILFKNKWRLDGSCRRCGQCCEEIHLKMTPGQLSNRFFAKLAVAWVSWLFGFVYLRTESTGYYVVFSCQHRLSDGRCGNYFWRPNICRNYPLVDYFDQPKLLPGCGFQPVQTR